ncbi:MAG: type III-B CRISPR module-associated protein Cmr5 [Saprospiraceae bacterium]
MAESTIKKLEEGRAKFAFDKATAAAANQSKKKDYKQYAKKMPMMIKSNGLGASIAFAFSKSKDKEGRITAWGLLYNDIDGWLRTDKKALLGNIGQNAQLADVIISLNSAEYRAVAVEVLAFLNWLRRFAEGLIEGEAEDN